MRTTRHRLAGNWMRISLVLAILAVVFGVAGNRLAAAPDDPIVEVNGEEKLVPIDFKDKPIAEIARWFSEQSKTNIIVDEGIFDRVSLTLPNPVPWRTALTIVVKRINCVVEDRPNGTMVIFRPKTFDISAQDQDIRDVLYAIAATSNQNIVVEGDIQGKISFNLSHVDWKSALYTVAKAGGYVVVEEDADRGIIYRIASPARLKDQAETKIFRLVYVRPPEEMQAQISTAFARDLSQTGGAAASVVGAEGGVDSEILERFTLKKALQATLSENGHLEYDIDSNSFMVTDIKPKLDAIEAIIKKVDVEPVQIMVEVKFVLTANNDLFDAGVDWQNGFTASLMGGSTLSRFPFNLASFGLQGLQVFQRSPNNSPRTGATGIGLGSDIGGALDPDQDGDFDSLPFEFGTLDFSAMKLLLKLFKSDTQSEIVQEPRLLMLDNKKATIFVGRLIHFAETRAASSQSGGLETSLIEAPGSPVKTGFQLFFVPHVIPGTDKVMMTVIPESETLVGTTSSVVKGFNDFTSESAGGQIQRISLPEIQTQSLVTTMMLESGQTAVIGGLVTSREVESVVKVPWLGDIPILGWVFRSESYDVQKQNLLIFVTPYVIRNPKKELTPMYEWYLEEQQRLFPWKYDRTEQERIDDAEDAAGKVTRAPRRLDEDETCEPSEEMKKEN